MHPPSTHKHTNARVLTKEYYVSSERFVSPGAYDISHKDGLPGLLHKLFSLWVQDLERRNEKT
eukprot:scaffold267224_cov21-Tisochrysis_lutea.AAC.1